MVGVEQRGKDFTGHRMGVSQETLHFKVWHLYKCWAQRLIKQITTGPAQDTRKTAFLSED